jgi:hypothetical protein
LSSRFWPVAEAAQADYEALRAAVLGGVGDPSALARARFARRGLAGLIAWPAAEPVWLGELLGAERPPWSGREDPRESALCEAYGLLLERASIGSAARAVAR